MKSQLLICSLEDPQDNPSAVSRPVVDAESDPRYEVQVHADKSISYTPRKSGKAAVATVTLNPTPSKPEPAPTPPAKSKITPERIAAAKKDGPAQLASAAEMKRTAEAARVSAAAAAKAKRAAVLAQYANMKSDAERRAFLKTNRAEVFAALRDRAADAIAGTDPKSAHREEVRREYEKLAATDPRAASEFHRIYKKDLAR